MQHLSLHLILVLKQEIVVDSSKQILICSAVTATMRVDERNFPAEYPECEHVRLDCVEAGVQRFWADPANRYALVQAHLQIRSLNYCFGPFSSGFWKGSC